MLQGGRGMSPPSSVAQHVNSTNLFESAAETVVARLAVTDSL
jgi:hypothetical protein